MLTNLCVWRHLFNNCTCYVMNDKRKELYDWYLNGMIFMLNHIENYRYKEVN